jgi:hypothetical protein
MHYDATTFVLHVTQAETASLRNAPINPKAIWRRINGEQSASAKVEGSAWIFQ